MKKEIHSLLKKTIKVAAVTCIVAGGFALLTSATAVKAVAEGARQLKNSAKKLADKGQG